MPERVLYRELLQVTKDLIEWDAHMGGHESVIWTKARRLVDAIRARTEATETGAVTPLGEFYKAALVLKWASQDTVTAHHDGDLKANNGIGHDVIDALNDAVHGFEDSLNSVNLSLPQSKESTNVS